MGLIYLAVNKTNGKRYVGQHWSNDLEARGYRRIAGARVGKNDSYFVRALKKYGHNGFEWSVVHVEVVADKLDALEIESIEYYGSLHPNGYNLRTGGKGGRHSEDVRKRLSESQKRRDPATRKHTEESKAKIAASNRRRRYSNATKQKLCESVSRLTATDVYQIRDRYAKGETPREIIQDFPQIKTTDNIVAIVNGVTWKHVGGPIGARRRGATKGVKQTRPRFYGGGINYRTPDQKKAEILELLGNNEPLRLYRICENLSISGNVCKRLLQDLINAGAVTATGKIRLRYSITSH